MRCVCVQCGSRLFKVTDVNLNVCKVFGSMWLVVKIDDYDRIVIFLIYYVWKAHQLDEHVDEQDAPAVGH